MDPRRLRWTVAAGALGLAATVAAAVAADPFPAPAATVERPSVVTDAAPADSAALAAREQRALARLEAADQLLRAQAGAAAPAAAPAPVIAVSPADAPVTSSGSS